MPQPITTVEYVVGSDLADVVLTWLDDDGDIIDFSAGWTFSLTVSTPEATAFTKSTGFTGAATAPNLSIQWATAGELNTITVGGYTVDVVARRTADAREREMQFRIVAIAVSGNWNYSDALTTNRDVVRFLVGDTDGTAPQFADGEISWALTVNSDPFQAAIIMCRGAIAKYSRRVSKTVGDLSLQSETMAQHYRDLVGDLEAQAALTSAVPVPYSGGRTESDKDIDRLDTDLVQPHQEVGEFDNTGSFPTYTRVLPT